MEKRRWRGRFVRAAVLSSTVLLTGTATPAAGAGGAEVQPPSECPAALPVSEVRKGMAGTGWATVEGRTPEPFAVEVLGVLPNAIGPGRDVIVVNASGAAIARAGGVWHGMSGAPVYVGDRLLGGVSFGLSFGPSSVIGLTAAEDMTALLSYPTSGGTSSASRPSVHRVALPAAVRQAVAETTGSSASDVGGLVQLRLPLSASGVTTRGMKRVARAIRREGAPFFAYSGSSASPRASAAPTGTVRPGEPFASVFSYGDVTLAATGTTTVVCGGMALAFAHPLLWQGRTSIGASAADVVAVVPDPILGPHALANVAEGVGTVDQDRLAGIRALLGSFPASIPIRSSVSAANTRRTRNGESVATTSDIVPGTAYLHLLGNIDVTFDQITPGSSRISFRIVGTREDGQAFTLGRTNMWASHWDISEQSVEELASFLYILFANRFEEIEFTGVHVSAAVEEEIKEFRISRVLVATGRGRYRPVKRVRAVPGSVVRLLVSLAADESPRARTVKMRLRIPRRAGRGGMIEITGGRFGGDELFCLFEPEECGEEFGPRVKSFDQLLRLLRTQPRNNVLVAALRMGPRGRVVARDRESLDRVVRGYRYVDVGPGGEGDVEMEEGVALGPGG